MRSDFEVVIGVDQTGAKAGAFGFKPLPVSLIFRKNKKWNLVSPLYLKSFSRAEIEALLLKLGIKAKWESILIVADCVLGLPRKVVKNRKPLSLLRGLMSKAHKFKGFGLRAGEQFFLEAFSITGRLESEDLLREQEKDLKCLSVFKNKPFQRNVQTGTYRIWSDLGEDKNYLHFSIWPYERASNKAYLCEGYPAHAKRVVKFLGSPPISNMKLYTEVSKDHKDAAALAILGLIHFDARLEIKYQKEGCILTAPQSLENL